LRAFDELWHSLVPVLLLVASLAALHVVAASPAAAIAIHSVQLPGGPPVSMDYLAYDASAKRLWVPAGNTGKVDVLDVESGQLHAVDGFPTVVKEGRGGKRVVGPSSVAIGPGVAYVGNRAGNAVCAVDARTLSRGACVALPAAPDGLVYVAPTHEVWATVPALKELVILDVAAGAPAIKEAIPLEGKPEGYAVDAAHGLYFTNLEDRDQTLAFDVRTRKLQSRWPTGCGSAGPRGMAFDVADRLLLVACTDGAVAFDAAGGAVRSRVVAGAGVDNVDYAPATRTLFVASGKTAELQLFHVAANGQMSLASRAPTAAGARVVVADELSRGYVADSAGGRVVVVDPRQ
jgi:DNA-binding beta-propeller fold protein YncE